VTKEDFDRELHNWLNGHNGFPFWCGSLKRNPEDPKNFVLQSGHPLDAKLVVVGYNPSSGVDEPWTDFWHREFGFDLNKFQDCRTAKCQRNGKGKSVSKTRKKIYRLVAETIAWDSVVVNTNIYWAVSSIAKKLPKEHREFAPIEWLLQKIPDAVVVCHGKTACEKYEELLQSDSSLPRAIYAARHLSRISNDDFQNLVGAVLKHGAPDSAQPRGMCRAARP
jgi:hypothetical protein